MNTDYSVYLVTDRPLCLGRNVLDVVREAVQAGATMVQLREKEASTREFVDLARAVKKITSALHVPLLINDRIDVALAMDADGVHIGQSDMNYTDARRLLGQDKLIGLSIDTEEQLREAELLDVNYLGLGPIFPTATKKDTKGEWGLEGLKHARSISRHPLVAIGGIGVTNATPVTRAGADGVAVVSAICSSPSPAQAVAALCRAVRNGRQPLVPDPSS